MDYSERHHYGERVSTGFVESVVNLARFNAGEIQRLACVARLSEGVNFPNLRTGIIWHAFGN